MVQAVVTLEERQDRVLNIVKGKYGLKNKSDAVNLVIEKFEEAFLEEKIRPEYRKELLKVDAGKAKKFSSMEELKRGLKNDRI